MASVIVPKACEDIGGNLAGSLTEAISAAARAGKLPNLHSVVLLTGNDTAVDVYFTGEDWCWGRPLGRVEFDETTLHDLRSISKSVVGLLYGIALDEGLVPALDQPIVDAFPEYAELAAEAARRRIAVEHVLTMQLGLEWDETLPYTNPANSEIAMERAEDRCRYVLTRPVREPPGSGHVYSGGATALLASLIRRGSGDSLLDYAKARLFEPLGIDAVEWTKGMDGIEAPASGLRMRPRDLARVGRMLLDGGKWSGRTVVPESWVAESAVQRVVVDDDMAYGYHWWVARRWNWFAAFGNGGQRMTLLPGLDAVLVVTAGNCDRPDAWRAPVSVLADFVVPHLTG